MNPEDLSEDSDYKDEEGGDESEEMEENHGKRLARSDNTQWTVAMLEALIVFKESGSKNSILENVSNRACQRRFKRLIEGEKPWTQEEEGQLRAQEAKVPLQDLKIPTRTNLQCRVAIIVRSTWYKDHEMESILNQMENGTQPLIAGRTAVSTRNRWYKMVLKAKGLWTDEEYQAIAENPGTVADLYAEFPEKGYFQCRVLLASLLNNKSVLAFAENSTLLYCLAYSMTLQDIGIIMGLTQSQVCSKKSALKRSPHRVNKSIISCDLVADHLEEDDTWSARKNGILTSAISSRLPRGWEPVVEDLSIDTSKCVDHWWEALLKAVRSIPEQWQDDDKPFTVDDKETLVSMRMRRCPWPTISGSLQRSLISCLTYWIQFTSSDLEKIPHAPQYEGPTILLETVDNLLKHVEKFRSMNHEPWGQEMLLNIANGSPLSAIRGDVLAHISASKALVECSSAEVFDSKRHLLCKGCHKLIENDSHHLVCNRTCGRVLLCAFRECACHRFKSIELLKAHYKDYHDCDVTSGTSGLPPDSLLLPHLDLNNNYGSNLTTKSVVAGKYADWQVREWWKEFSSSPSVFEGPRKRELLSFYCSDFRKVFSAVPVRFHLHTSDITPESLHSLWQAMCAKSGIAFKNPRDSPNLACTRGTYGAGYGSGAYTSPIPKFQSFAAGKPYVQIDTAGKSVEQIKAQLKASGCFALLTEVVRWQDGRPMPPKEYISIRKACDESGIVLIADETLSLLRCGAPFAYQRPEYQEVRPDFIFFGKGLKVSGVAVDERGTWITRHGITNEILSTFCIQDTVSNVLETNILLQSLGVIRRADFEKWPSQSERIGEVFRTYIHPAIVEGLGSLMYLRSTDAERLCVQGAGAGKGFVRWMPVLDEMIERTEDLERMYGPTSTDYRKNIAQKMEASGERPDYCAVCGDGSTDDEYFCRTCCSVTCGPCRTISPHRCMGSSSATSSKRSRKRKGESIQESSQKRQKTGRISTSKTSKSKISLVLFDVVSVFVEERGKKVEDYACVIKISETTVDIAWLFSKQSMLRQPGVSKDRIGDWLFWQSDQIQTGFDKEWIIDKMTDVEVRRICPNHLFQENSKPVITVFETRNTLQEYLVKLRTNE